MSETSRLAQVRAHLDLPILKRAAGLLEGFHRSIYKGQGQDFDDLSLYNPGDDISDIDWKSSARAGIPIIRRFAQQSNLSLILVVDTGRNMAALSSEGNPKSKTAVFLASLVAYVARDRGDRVALVAGDAERLFLRPPRSSTQDLEVMLTQIANAFDVQAPASDLNILLERVLNTFHRRSLVVLITDEVRPAPEHEKVLRKLKVRHELMVLQVSDASPFVGSRLKDQPPIYDVDRPLNMPRFLGRDPKIQQEAIEHVLANRKTTSDLLQRLGIATAVFDGEDNALVRFTQAVMKQMLT